MFASAAPRVTLVNATAEPYNNAIATARTCYSARVITPADVVKDERAIALRERIAASTYEAGHHTTLQHATFQFVLENVSRQLLWSFLHAHPHYNSEQVSQRYVAVRPERVTVPQLAQPVQQERYEACVRRQMADYVRLTELLTEPATEAYFRLFPARRKKAEEHRGAIKKRAQEAARYVLPLATHAHLYHTINGLTLHRYRRLAAQWDVPYEARCVVEGMVAAVQAHDPLFFSHAEDPVPLEETPEYVVMSALAGAADATDAGAYARDFDARLQGRRARLVDWSANAEVTLAEAVRNVFGASAARMPNDEAIAWVLDPARGRGLRGALNLSSMSKLGRTLVHPHYTFAKKLSHAADSQNQRHRLTPGSRPVLWTTYAGGAPDVVAPTLIDESAEAAELFAASTARSWADIDALLDAGVPHEQALYLLPNAVAVRFYESGDLQGLMHKWTSRLCYNAQEEIWRASLDEVAAVAEVHPRLVAWALPPCGPRARAKVRPVCPEGSRYCGVPVWKLAREQYTRVL